MRKIHQQIGSEITLQAVSPIYAAVLQDGCQTAYVSSSCHLVELKVYCVTSSHDP